MLPTPDTSHVPYERVYEPSEDSFLLLDTLSSDGERQFLRQTVAVDGDPAPLVVEVGTGSGVVLAFVHAHARDIFGTGRVLTAGVDVNAYACRATVATVRKAQQDAAAAADAAPTSTEASPGGPSHAATYLGACMGDLASPWRPNSVDVLIFNPPYVPTPALPVRPEGFDDAAAPPQQQP
ncbi:hypothetical protein HIM_06983 [Hirsutella minnesotensis 3608]|uniref:Methyltransferase small domain-containing protein n=1 Tax=Hirsutella minnesotensis 3608 TaxID=1043627 RepID=A0A0F7ZNF3_9HYPO|nr:hypothetical protein HIM_06983 [Hirsutella minnesotensis 3608]